MTQILSSTSVNLQWLHNIDPDKQVSLTPYLRYRNILGREFYFAIKKEPETMVVRISVRGLVEFILRSGDIDNRKAAFSENAMQEGGRIHRMIQRRMGPEYHAEVSLSYRYPVEGYDILIEGRADGIIIEASDDAAGVPELVDSEIKPEQTGDVRVTIDEIKGTFRDLKKMKEPVPVHLAQAKCYACIYGEQNSLGEICVRMTYCHM